MHVVIVQDPAEVARTAADLMASVIRERAAEGIPAVLGLATGSTPEGTYAELARRVEDGSLDTAGVQAFALDEYAGLSADHPASYRAFVEQRVTKPLRLDPARVHVPDGTAEDLDAACADYERLIAEVDGVDLQLLGIGGNGHLGFNEPASAFDSRTRVKTLAPRTRIDNSRHFDSLEEVPTHCITQGLGTIRDAKRLLLVAQGLEKADAVARMVEGPVTSICPATVLQFHPAVTVIVDRAAASRLELRDYYEHILLHQRPAPVH
ncbi:glucosamine-6-phosphate deaminase [Leucobacter sp. GX24907]